MTAIGAIQHPLCPADFFNAPQNLSPIDGGEKTLYPWITRIMGLAKFDKMAIYDNQEMMKNISPYVLPAGFLPSFPETYCRGPNDFQYQFFSFFCEVEDPAGAVGNVAPTTSQGSAVPDRSLAEVASTLGKKVQIFVLDPGKVKYYDGWWGIVNMPWALGGGQSDNVMGDKMQHIVEELLVKKHFVYDTTNIKNEKVHLHLKVISHIAEDALNAPPAAAASVAPTGKRCVII